MNTSAGGWNRPTQNRPAEKKGRVKSPSAMRGVVVGVLAVAIGVGCYFAFRPSPQAAKPEVEKERGRIKEVTPAPAIKKVQPAPVEEVKTNAPTGFRSKFTKKVFKSEEEMLRWEKQYVVRPHFTTGKKTIRCVNFAESEIVRVLNTKPGDPVLQLPMPRNFEEMMTEALVHKVTYEEDDPDYYKEDVARLELAKKELRAMLKEGKNLRQIMTEEAESLRKAAQLKEDVKAVLRETAANPDATLADLEDAEKAANMILEKNGVQDKVRVSMKAKYERGATPPSQKEKEPETEKEVDQ